MAGLSIGEVARRAGLRASAIRYYERLGLLPAPARDGGWRDYGSDEVLERLALIRFARATGFTLVEIQQLFGLTPGERRFSRRMRALARSKIDELDAIIARAQAMKTLLGRALDCQCLDVRQCGRAILRG